MDDHSQGDQDDDLGIITVTLRCPKSEKDICKALGGKFDWDIRKWQVATTCKSVLVPFKRWMTLEDRIKYFGSSEARILKTPKPKVTRAEPDPSRFYLNCPYREKDECKRLGGLWDDPIKKWFVPPELSREPFARWFAVPTPQTTAPASAVVSGSKRPREFEIDGDDGGGCEEEESPDAFYHSYEEIMSGSWMREWGSSSSSFEANKQRFGAGMCWAEAKSGACHKSLHARKTPLVLMSV